MLLGPFETSDESGAEELGVTDEELLVNNEGLSILCNDDGCALRVRSATDVSSCFRNGRLLNSRVAVATSEP
jgi:hypothetical protein